MLTKITETLENNNINYTIITYNMNTLIANKQGTHKNNTPSTIIQLHDEHSTIIIVEDNTANYAWLTNNYIILHDEEIITYLNNNYHQN